MGERKVRRAPGKPGASPHWSDGKKRGIGTARSALSQVWFTVSRGTLDEVYYPSCDTVAVKDLELIVGGPDGWISEEARATDASVEWVGEGVAALRIVNTCREGNYRLEKTLVADPRRDVLLLRIRLVALKQPLSALRLYVVLQPHLGSQGRANSAWLETLRGAPQLLAERDSLGVAMAASVPWLRRSAGYVGVSDGKTDLRRHRHLAWAYDEADDGNIALAGELDLSGGGEVVLALGFGRTAREGAHRARASLAEGFAPALEQCEQEWRAWLGTLEPLDRPGARGPATYRTSAMTLAVHEAKALPGGLIASLSFPWGQARGDEDDHGYHLVWPRDTYEIAGGLLAAGRADVVARVLTFLEVTQEADGRWQQNLWLDGTPFWERLQLDEVAEPILLVDLAFRNRALDEAQRARLWPMVRAAAAFIVRNGPITEQDRWEIQPGINAFTVGAAVAALLVAADFAAESREPEVARYLRETADAWREGLDRWLYVRGSPLARELGIGGYYMWTAPRSGLSRAPGTPRGFLALPDRLRGPKRLAAEQSVSADTLSLIRFGLRAPDDPRIAGTLRAIDARLRIETPRGPAWRRYVGDGYGEGPRGEPFLGKGIGRLWPVLVGERAHFELAAGRRDEAERLLAVLESLAGDTGLLPEQIWDAAPLPARDLFPGRPTGSAQPLAWAHAEHIKLLRSLRDGRLFDASPQPARRYLGTDHQAAHHPWRLDLPSHFLTPQRILRVEHLRPFALRWQIDGARVREAAGAGNGLGLYFVDLPTEDLPRGARVRLELIEPGRRHRPAILEVGEPPDGAR